MSEFKGLTAAITGAGSGIGLATAKMLADGGATVYGLDIEKTLSEVREKTGAGKISFSGRKKIETVEKEFEEIFGLYVQICYTEGNGNRYYTTGEDSKTLTVLNREKEASGCKKGEWN